MPTEVLLAQITVSKYADALPLYRQEGIYARDGVTPSRFVLAGWTARVGFHLARLSPTWWFTKSGVAVASLLTRQPYRPRLWDQRR
jgi:transposase